MIIKKEEKKKRKSFFSFNSFVYYYFFSTLVVALSLIIVILKSQTFEVKKNKYLDFISKGGRFEYLYLPNIAIKALKSNFYKIQTLNLEIPFEQMLIIENLRKKALSDGFLPSADQMPKVKTNIIFNDDKFRGDIRLKGDRDVHYADKKKSSYKIELDKNQYIFGIKKFSLQKPRTRNYIHEWIFHQMAKDFNIIKIKYDFIKLSVNGENTGLYVLEEGFGKELIERNERRNGPIFGINEDVVGIDGLSDKPVFEIYNKNYWSRPENSSIVRTASQKLRDFFNNKIELEEIFDLEKWSAYFAVIDFTSNYHGALLKSVKLYYNPINGLFEPIPFDGHRLKPNYNKYNLDYDNRILIDVLTDPSTTEEKEIFEWLKKFFFKGKKLNQEFYNLYVKNLNTISSDQYIKKFLKKNLEKIEQINSHIYADYFFYDNSRNYGIGLYYFSLDDFYHQARNIKNKLKISRKIQVLKHGKSDFIVKNYYKNYGSEIVEKLVCNNNNQISEIKINKSLNNFADTKIRVSEEKIKKIKCTHVNFINKFNKISTLFKIDYTNSEYSYNRFKKFNPEIIEKYFKVLGKDLLLVSEEINIDQNLYIPRGFRVIIKPGQKIFLTNGAFIISNSPWKIGGYGKKVIISGEKNNFGGGILITDTNQKSIFQNVKFAYLGGIKRKHFTEKDKFFFDTLTEYSPVKKNNYKERLLKINKNYYDNSLDAYLILGAINIHNSEIDLKNVIFNRISSEDALNIISSRFDAQNLIFIETASDGVDLDFSQGKFNKINFDWIGNDAIDLSGSNVSMTNIKLSNIGDKLISVGENSEVIINHVEGSNSYAGIVSKDGSNIFASNISMRNVKIPFSAYKKKEEYNFPKMKLSKINVENYKIKWLKDKGSELFYEKEKVGTKTKNIIPIIYRKNLDLVKLIKNENEKNN